MPNPNIKQKPHAKLDLALGLGPYSNLSGDTPDVFEPISRGCFPLGLSCPPHNSVKLEECLSEIRVPKKTVMGRFLNYAVEFPSDIIKSNNFYTSIGNIVMTSYFYSGLALHPICAALAIFNERRERRKESQVSTKSLTWLSQEMNDTLQSPGIYRLVLGGAFLVNMIEAHSVGNHLFGLIYGFASLGNLGAGRILNQDYWKKLRADRKTDTNNATSPEEYTWTKALTNPGINWCASDVLVGAMTLQATTIASQLSIGISTGFAVLGLGIGINFGKNSDKSPLPLFLNGCCNLGFAFTHASWGSDTDVICGIPKIAIATGAWGIASFIIAAKQHINYSSKYRRKIQ